MRRDILNLFGLGTLPFGASLASLLAVVLYLGTIDVLYLPRYSIWILFVLILGATLLYARNHAEYLLRDPKEVVIDEYLGMFILLAIAGTTAVIHLAILFVVFRFFDLYKIWPISALDRMKWENGFLSDDIALGIIIGILYRVLLFII